MIVVRKRLLFWLIRAYLKKWGRIIFLSFVGGLIGFFFIIFFFSRVAHLFPQKSRIAMVGAYTLDRLPPTITNQLSRGLTKVTASGEVKPDLAASWEVRNNGKKYIFYLNKGIRFSNGKEVTSRTLGYDFKDVKMTTPDDYTVVFELKDQYAPFLVTVSRPIFPKGLQGLGPYTISDIKINGDYISSLTLTAAHNKRKQVVYLFYPNQEAVKTAYLLGDATQVTGLNETYIANHDLQKFRNTRVSKQTNYHQLVTIFYNTKDKTISDNKLRKALTYALPDKFAEGERAQLPYSPKSIYYNKDAGSRSQDLAHAQLLIEASMGSSSNSAIPPLTLTTLTKYKKVAQRITKVWSQLGIKTKVVEVDTRPDVFQMYLGDFLVPSDPDQYVLWHSRSESNITKFDSKRIDKLLEDGRRTIDSKERKQIYSEFQKYLMDDAVIDTPASFLYFPYSYTLTRR